jgi:hypothetical protein
MKFILMMHTPDRGPYQILQWPQKDLQAHIAFHHEFNGKLQKTASTPERDFLLLQTARLGDARGR